MRETASKSALLLSGCLRWAHPAAKWYQSIDEDKVRFSKREEGKLIHQAIHLHNHSIPYTDLLNEHNASQSVSDKAYQAACYLDEKLGPRCVRIESEVAMGIDFDTGEVVQPKLEAERGYPDDDCNFYGTADLVCHLHNGGLLVADWKTGSTEGAELQLKSLMAMASRLWPARHYRIATLLVTENEVISDEREISMEEILGHQLEIARSLRMARASDKPTLPVIGSYCTEMYCPHLAKCPSTIKSSVVIDNYQGNESFNEEPGSEGHAGWMACRLKAVKRATEYYTMHLKDWVKKGNRARWDGMEFKETNSGFRLVKNK